MAAAAQIVDSSLSLLPRGTAFLDGQHERLSCCIQPTMNVPSLTVTSDHLIENSSRSNDVRWSKLFEPLGHGMNWVRKWYDCGEALKLV